MKYGLIGEKLGHSYSCQVHRALGNPDYELREIAPEALGDFLRARDFAGLNVTIPYKQAVIPYVDALTDTAREVGAVNTLYFEMCIRDRPVIVDPSHASGTSRLVKPLSMASVAAGADGLIIEVHNDPPHALCDGAQSLSLIHI